MVEPVTIGIDNNKWLKDSDTKLITLSTAELDQYNEKSMHDESDSDYLVPVGKQFIILKMQMNNQAKSKLVQELYFHTVADAAGGTRFVYVATSDTECILNWKTYLTIPASNYVNIKGLCAMSFTGIETTV